MENKKRWELIKLLQAAEAGKLSTEDLVGRTGEAEFLIKMWQQCDDDPDYLERFDGAGEERILKSEHDKLRSTRRRKVMRITLNLGSIDTVTGSSVNIPSQPSLEEDPNSAMTQAPTALETPIPPVPTQPPWPVQRFRPIRWDEQPWVKNRKKDNDPMGWDIW